MKTLTPSILELTDNFSIETNSKDLSISHEIINDELKLKITSNYSQIPSRIKLISSNRSNFKIIADIYLNENATLEIIDENDYIIDTSFILKSFLGSRSVLELYRFNKFQSDTNNSFVHTCNMSNGSMFKDFNFTKSMVLIGLLALQLEALNVEKSLVPTNFFAPNFIKSKSNFFLTCQT